MDKQKTQLEPWKPDHYVMSGKSYEVPRRGNRGPHFVSVSTDIINNMIKSAKD